MKSKSVLLLSIGIILLSFTSIYPSNICEDIKKNASNEINSFWLNNQLNCETTKEFNANNYWNQKETIFFNDWSVTISNKKKATSKDNSYEDRKGNNKQTDIKSGGAKWIGFRFQNLNITANVIIDNVKLTLYNYKYGNTTVNVKAENLKSPTSYIYVDDLSSKSTTSKSVDWYIPKLSNGLELTSPNIRDVVQEVVNIKGDIIRLSLITQPIKKWEGSKFDDRSSSYNPKIHINYTVDIQNVIDNTHTIGENRMTSVNTIINDYNIPEKCNISFNQKNIIATITDPNNTPNNPSDYAITHTPTPNYDRTDTFVYSVCDKNNCDSANVSVIIKKVVDPFDARLASNLDTGNDKFLEEDVNYATFSDINLNSIFK